MSSDLNGKTIAFLATDGVERVELQTPRDAIIAAGGSVVLLTIDDLSVSLWDDDEDRAGTERADRLVGGADIDDYDALVLPGGVRNPDKLRIDADAVAFARAFVESGRPVAAICHGPWLLAEADVVRSRRLTSFPSLQPICATLAPCGSTKRSSTTEGSSQAGTLTIWKPSAPRCSKRSRGEPLGGDQPTYRPVRHLPCARVKVPAGFAQPCPVAARP